MVRFVAVEKAIFHIVVFTADYKPTETVSFTIGGGRVNAAIGVPANLVFI